MNLADYQDYFHDGSIIDIQHKMELILQKFPGFQPMWSLYKSQEYETLFRVDMCKFSSYVADLRKFFHIWRIG